MDARTFLAELRAEVQAHPAVAHSLLGRCRIDPRDRTDFRIFSGQHYPLVGTFTRYLELLLISAPSSTEKCWLAKVLVDEYGERSAHEDHAAHYRRFMRACGWAEGAWEDAPLHPSTPAFLREHLSLCADEDFLIGLGAVGPGHEWAIPTMFERIIEGLQRAGFAPEEIEYFTLHTQQDQDHGAWLEEALLTMAGASEAQERIRAGCRRSLAAREALWWGIADCINAERMRSRFGAAAASGGGSAPRESLRQLRESLRVDVRVGMNRG